jgi:lipopolysaccharide transport system permease protein
MYKENSYHLVRFIGKKGVSQMFKIDYYRKWHKDLSLYRRKWHHFLDLVIQRAWVGLRAEATRGYLGVLWWVLEPLIYMLVFYTIFSHVLHRGDEDYIYFLLIGLIVWKWFQATVMSGSNSLFVNAGLMNQVYVPKIIFPMTNIAVNTFKFFIIITLLLLFLQSTQHSFAPSWILLPILILVQLALIMAVTCVLAAVIPFLPDLRLILDNVLTMMFFMSGIFFDIDRLPDSMSGYFFLNPMASIINMYRKIILDGLMPDWQQIIYILLFSFFLFLIAVFLFRRYDRIYPKIIY